MENELKNVLWKTYLVVSVNILLMTGLAATMSEVKNFLPEVIEHKKNFFFCGFCDIFVK